MAERSNEDVVRLFGVVMGAPRGERGAMLDRECAGDVALRKRIEAMIAAAEGGGGADVAAEAATLVAPTREGVGSKIGPYKLLERIGEGGFGSVYMAEQEHPVRRRVALKVIKLGMDTMQVVARFEQERQALAIMDHPGIAKVFDAGVSETGRPYFVMELCKGEAITDYCDKHNLSVPERLELFAQVCTAVQHAHTKGIIHRDIKGGNILVSTQDGRPHAKVIDFGIAKATQARLTERTLFTEHRQLIGTPEYMSPEQAEGSLDIDTRTDVYSLGVLLYELLTGGTPFSGQELRSAAYDEMQRKIREEDPPKPSTRLSKSGEMLAGVATARKTVPRKLCALMRGELDWIVMKALEKDRQRRYDSASGFALDVRRYLSGEAVQAAPPGVMYSVRKFVARHRFGVAAGVAVFASLMVGVVAFAWQARVARQQRDRAFAAETEAKTRSAELEQVARFQEKMLSQIDTADAGVWLMQDLRRRHAEALETLKVPEGERPAATEGFERELARVNATDAAGELITRTILKPAITAVDTQFESQPLVGASLRATLSEVYKTIGGTETALKLQEQVLATRRKLLGELDPRTLRSKNDMGMLLEANGKLPEAEEYYKQAYEESRRALGKDDGGTLLAMGNLGNYYRSMGKLEEAKPLLSDALEGYRRVFGNEYRETLVAMNTLGFLYADQGKFADTEPLWREAYETGRRALGENDRDVLVWTNNLAGLLSAQSKRAEAEPLFRASVEGHRRILGEEHPSTLTAAGALASCLGLRGKDDEAEPLLLQTIATAKRVLGGDHPSTMSLTKDLGLFYQARGKLDQAEPLLRENLAYAKRVYGPEHQVTLDMSAALAKLLQARGDIAGAEALYRESIGVMRRTLGPDHPVTLVALVSLGGMLMTEGRLDEAEPILQEVVDRRMKTSGELHMETLVARSNLTYLIELRGRNEEAEALYRDILAKCRSTIGDTHPTTLSSISNLASPLRKMGKLAESEALYRESRDGFVKGGGKDSLRGAISGLGLGRTLCDMKRFTEAEVEMLETDRVYSIAQGVSASRKQACWESIVDLYEAWNNAEPGKGYDAKAAQWKAKLPAKKAK